MSSLDAVLLDYKVACRVHQALVDEVPSPRSRSRSRSPPHLSRGSRSSRSWSPPSRSWEALLTARDKAYDKRMKSTVNMFRYINKSIADLDMHKLLVDVFIYLDRGCRDGDQLEVVVEKMLE